MGKGMLIIVASFAVIFGTISITLNKANFSDRYTDVVVRNVANSGLNAAKRQIGDSPSWRTGYSALSVAGGNANVSLVDTIVAGQGAVKITSTGNYMGKTCTVSAVVQSGSANAVPAAFQYALLTNAPLIINGCNDFDSSSTGNADVHTNSNLIVNGTNNFDGFLTYTGTKTLNGTNTINPPYNPNGFPSVSQHAAVPIPAFDPTLYQSIATQVIIGNYTVNGSQSMGGSSSPQIWYINGNLTVNGNISGYGIWIVDGNVILNGTCQMSTGGDKSSIAFFCGGNMTINGNDKVAGEMYVKGSLTLNGTVKIRGSIIVASGAGNTILNGGVTIDYLGANRAITQQVFACPPAGRPIVLSYWE
jgi:hypothetical protein